MYAVTEAVALTLASTYVVTEAVMKKQAVATDLLG